MDLKDIRPRIDAIDTQLTELLVKRFELCTEVAKIKAEQNLPVSHPEREKQIIENVISNSSPYGEQTAEVFKTILSSSVTMQIKLLDKLKGNK